MLPQGGTGELIHHHWSYHREYINSRRPSPHIYNMGNLVYAKRSLKSIKKRGLVGKLMESFTGPWKVVDKLQGSSYTLSHCDSAKPGKRHAAQLSPYPRELLPFTPVDSADNRYGQLHMLIGPNPYSNAGIKGFKPTQPFNFVSIHIASSVEDSIHFPSLSELNAEMFEWYIGEDEALAENESLCIELDAFVTNASAEPTPPPITVPTAAPLAPVLLTLSDLTAQASCEH